LIATKTGLSLGDYVVTEAGFGADLGAEKFINIKCQSAGMKPDAVVLVATIKALKHHGGVSQDMLSTPDPAAVERGFCNLEKHIENIQTYGLNPVVAINSFYMDTEEEYDVVRRLCTAKGVTKCIWIQPVN
jgi:formate--tetrahydrofolate ligase